MLGEYLPPVILTGYDLVTDPKNTPPKLLNLYAYLDEFPRVFQINILAAILLAHFTIISFFDRKEK